MSNNFTTVPNQRTIVVHRTQCDKDFLQIKKSTLFEAYNTLGATALFLYLYFVGNRDNYQFAFSPSAIHRATGMPESTCRDQFNKLIACKYLVPRREGSNIYDFYEIPQRAPFAEHTQTADGLDFTTAAFVEPQTVQSETGEGIEININKIDTINRQQEKQVSPAAQRFDF